MCLDDGGLIVLERPDRVFDYLSGMPLAIAEVLVVPLRLDKGLAGTLWIVHHDLAAHFCSDDARMAERLALHLVWALKLLQLARGLTDAGKERGALVGRDLYGI